LSRSSALADAAPACFWLDSPDRPDPADPLGGDTRCDLAVVGAGYTGLWTALLAKEADPSRDVVLLDAGVAGWAASGRNGGFCAASLTHGLDNGLSRFPDELRTLERLGLANLDAIEASVRKYDIDCGFERTGRWTWRPSLTRCRGWPRMSNGRAGTGTTRCSWTRTRSVRR